MGFIIVCGFILIITGACWYKDDSWSPNWFAVACGVVIVGISLWYLSHTYGT